MKTRALRVAASDARQKRPRASTAIKTTWANFKARARLLRFKCLRETRRLARFRALLRNAR